MVFVLEKDSENSILKTLQLVCRKVKKQRSMDSEDAPPRQCNEFSKENSGGLQVQYPFSRPVCAVRGGTGLFCRRMTHFGIPTFRCHNYGSQPSFHKHESSFKG